jgi:tRNA threonylcarbamoyladenosine biosynthesis protein TsaB
MRILGVDTSSPRASVALASNGLVISETFSPDKKHSAGRAAGRNNHAEVLFQLIDSALTKAGWRLGDLSGFAAAIGPGSFTGLRIGVSTIQGLSYGSGSAVTGVSTLHACAYRVRHFDGAICAILDARKNELYGALFRRRDGSLERITPDQLMSFQQLVELVGSLERRDPILFTGAGIGQHADSLLHALGKQIFLSENELVPTVASAVALLGEIAFRAPQEASRAPLTLQYLRASEAEERMRKLA